VILIAFPQRQQWLQERTSMLRYTYIVCLVGSGCIQIIIRPCHCALQEPVGLPIKLNRINGKPVDPIVNEESWVRRCVPGMILTSLHIRRRQTTPRHATPRRCTNKMPVHYTSVMRRGAHSASTSCCGASRRFGIISCRRRWHVRCTFLDKSLACA